LANVFSHTTMENDDRFVENVWPMNGFNIITTGLESFKKCADFLIQTSAEDLENKILLIVKVMRSRY
jgi:hypothetical protein